MRRILSLFIAVSFILSAVGVYAETDTKEMEQVLISVKSKIDIPEEMTEFDVTSGKYSDKSNTYYAFDWSTPDGSSYISAEADGKGNIYNYYYYYRGIYDEMKGISGKARADYFAEAEAFLKKAAPDLFENESDCLVLNESKSSTVKSSQCSVYFERSKDGIPVPSNNAQVNIIFSNDKFTVRNANIVWGYDAEFEEYSGEGLTSAKEIYFENYPVEPVYTISYEYDRESGTHKKTPKLEYRFKDGEMGYISAVTGEKVIEDADAAMTSGGGSNNKYESAAAEESAADVALSPAEIKELDTISGLYSAENIVEKINEMKFFGKAPEASGFSNRVSKSDEGYVISMHHYSDNLSMSVTADAETGKITNLYSYEYKDDYKREELSESDRNKAKAEIDKFVNKYYKDEASECTELSDNNRAYEYSVSSKRIVNGILCPAEGMHITYDVNRGVVSDFSLNMTKDTSVFPSPEGMITVEEAENAMLNHAPLTHKYIASGGKFVLCWSPDAPYAFNIDAFTGNSDSNVFESEQVYSYTDISGHWAEEKIIALSECGACPDRTEFMPDSYISQKDLLVLFYSGMYYRAEYSESFCETLENMGIIKKDELNPDAPVTRETAFSYMTSFMGLSEIASMNDIFKTDFADNSSISEDKIGSAAILKGYGIISGDGNTLRPGDNITNAEAAVILYNYLVKN